MSGSVVVSIAPHDKSALSTKKIMWGVVLSLAPAGAAGAYIFGARCLALITASIISAVITEAVLLGLRRKEISVYDGSAVLTGLLLAYNLPPAVPVWIAAAGSFFAIAVGKQVFGGLGHNIFNPALIGRAFLMTSWPVYMTTWQSPRWHLDAVSSATPLAIVKHGGVYVTQASSYLGLLVGDKGGCIGEVSVAALLIGAASLFWRGCISWHIPASYVITVAAASWAFNGLNGFFTGDALFFVLSGGLALGAFFMATDYVTSPLSGRGKLIFGAGCGILTFLIRRFAGYPEGVSYSILIMNAFVPILDRYTFPKWFGYKRSK